MGKKIMKKRIKGTEENVKMLYVYVFLFCFAISGGSVKGYHEEEFC